MKKRLLSAFMALALCLTLLPAPAWAEEADAPEGGAPAADEQPAVQSEPAPQAAEAAVQAAEAAVAEVGGVNYNNIQEAFEKVKQSNGGTLTLLANCELPYTAGNRPSGYDASGSYTLDLNGHSLTAQNDAQIILEDDSAKRPLVTFIDSNPGANKSDVTVAVDCVRGNNTPRSVSPQPTL